MFLDNSSKGDHSLGLRSVIGWLALVAILSCVDAPRSAVGAQESDLDVAMTEDVRRMHERLVALSEGEGSPSSLRIEFMDGSGMSSHRSFELTEGTLVSKEWKSIGSPMIHRQGSVADSRVSTLLRELIAKRYWAFEGTRFIPDAPMFLFRFYYGDLPYVDFRCDAHEFRESETRAAIRDAFLEFIDETKMSTVPAKP